MSDSNPYSSPKAEATEIDIDEYRVAEMEFKQLKKTYNKSIYISLLALVLLLGLLSAAILPIYVFEEAIEKTPLLTIIALIALAGFYILTVICLFRRSNLGRTLGIIASYISLLGFPIGTIIGIASLLALYRSSELFGEDRIKHKDLEKAFKINR